MTNQGLTSFKEKSIEEQLAFVKEAVIDYRNDGKKLMHKLAEKFTLDIESKNDYEKLISKSYETIPRKGELSKRWNYCFHGGECGFYNKKYKQRVEVVLLNPPEFGHLDCWFLLSYMESTEKYKKEIKGTDWLDLKPLIEKLYTTGEIEQINK